VSESPHPIVAQTEPNEEQLPAIRARGCDVVVTAGAGTGKTRTLVARYLSLLEDGKPLRSIVAITFTRKAAREMRNRVRAQIQRYVARTDLSAEERDRWQAIYAGLDAARIGTIHSLCTEILRAHPAEAQVDPRFQVLEEGQAAVLRREVLEAALAWAADEASAAELFGLLEGPGRLRETTRKLLNQRLEAVEAFASMPADPLIRWGEILRERQRSRVSDLASDPAWIDAVATLRQAQPADYDDRMAAQRQRALDSIREAGLRRRVRSPQGEDAGGCCSTEPIVEQLASLSKLGGISLVGGSYKAWPGGKAEKERIKNALRALRRLWKEHAKVLSLRLTGADEQAANAIPGLQTLFRFAQQRYEAEKRNRGALDFDDLESGALCLLQDHPEVLARWQREVEAILVDEFQDTNQRQRDLVHVLSRDRSSPSPGRLFVVGDAKQSIYGFRGADVTVFRAERDRIVGRAAPPDGRGESYALRTSYRAHHALVRALNDLLKPVLGEEADPRRPWAEPFAPIRAFREAPRPGIEAPYVEFHLTVGSKSHGALDRAARALVGRIAQMVENGRSDSPGQSVEAEADSRETHSLGYGDVAILCRASSSFSYYEDALDDAGLPYVTVAGRGFYDRPEIRDLLNALRALADPIDDLALVGLLRSPALGLSDGAIYRLVEARESPSIPLWKTLCREGLSLGLLSEGRPAGAASLIRKLHSMVGRASVSDLLKAFLDETHYRAALLKAGQQRAVRNVHKLLGDAHTSSLVSVTAFLEYVSGLQDSGAREGEARAAADGAVQIMSVHQAKGLEFPVVVLGDASWGGGNNRREVLVDPALGVLLPLTDEEDELPAIYRLAQAREEDQAAAEADRLLYVAATRAREKLLVSGFVGGIRKSGTPHKLGGWLGKLGRPLGLHEIEIHHDEHGSLVHRHRLTIGETAADCLIYEPEYAHSQSPTSSGEEETERFEGRLPPPLLAPIPLSDDLEMPGQARQRISRVVPDARGATVPSRVVGDLVHEALAAWQVPGKGDDEHLKKQLRSRARAKGLVDCHQVAGAGRRSYRLLRQLHRHPLFEELDTAERRLHEVPFSVERRGQVDSGKIDLLYQRDDTWTIVEFKTDRVRGPAHLEELLEENDYVRQARRYATVVESLLEGRPRCLLCMLDYDGITRFLIVPEAGPLRLLRTR
jgi:ATP-dependent helicase/nuclease subunit A